MTDKTNTKKLRLNSITSCLLQIITIVSGFIIPRLILGAYGSDVYGLVNSITQFLYVISFMEMGVGAVTQSALYKPLAEKNYKEVSAIFKSTAVFFRRIAIILAGYIIVLVVVYPGIVADRFDAVFTILLILAIGSNSFLQYFIGMPERLLLLADQRGYVQYISHAITLTVNTIICAVLIRSRMPIQAVKAVSALVFLIRPVFIRIYVSKHYSIDRKIHYDEEPISQKWNGIAQHIAAVILDQTDIVVLTLFSTLSNVSVYSVYHLVTHGIKTLFLSLMGGVQPLMGEYIAKEEKKELHALFDRTEWLLHTGTTILFVCAGILIVPFVQIYTKGVNDAEYIVPLFAALITFANAGHCLRLPYNILILAAGHYKQTQHNYIIAALMNILISVIAVRKWGLVGVAVGTAVAMIYQTIWMACYDSKNILEYPMSRFWKHCLVDVMIAACTILATMSFKLQGVNYVSWILLALEKGAVCVAVSLLLNLVFYKDSVCEVGHEIAKYIRRDR